MARIVWTTAECAALAAHVATQVQSNPNVKLLHALRDAQTAVLHRDRHRDITNVICNAPWLEADVKSIIAEREKLAKQVQQDVDAALQPDPPTAPTEIDLDTVPTEKLIAALLARFNLNLGQLVTQAIANKVVPTPPAPTKVAQYGGGQHGGTSRPRKPKIVIIGLLNSQATEINKSHKDKFDINYIAAHQTKIDSALHNADAVFIMVGFVNHSIYETAKTNAKKFFPISGGITTLKSRLDAVHAQLS